jgi:hypothetical protein
LHGLAPLDCVFWVVAPLILTGGLWLGSLGGVLTFGFPVLILFVPANKNAVKASLKSNDTGTRR